LIKALCDVLRNSCLQLNTLALLVYMTLCIVVFIEANSKLAGYKSRLNNGTYNYVLLNAVQYCWSIYKVRIRHGTTKGELLLYLVAIQLRIMFHYILLPKLF